MFFTSKGTEGKARLNASARATPSLFSSDLQVRGDLVTQGELLVDGQVTGDIIAKKLTIGPAAVISGTITAETMVISGTVRGRIQGTTVALTRTARVNADITHESLSIETGAFFEGSCKCVGESAGKVAIADQGRGLIGRPAALTSLAPKSDVSKPAKDGLVGGIVPPLPTPTPS
jgi:cytoskeletal protein CcmA (bactofilin family)